MNETAIATETTVTTPPDTGESTATVTETPPAAGTDDATGTGADTTATGEDTTAAADTTLTDGDPTPPAQPTTIPIKYNGETIELPYEDAVRDIQRGRMYHEKLHRLASDSGVSVDDYVNGLYTAQNEALYQQMLERANGDEAVARDLYELAMQKRNTAYKQAQDTEKQAAADRREALNQRLATEFIDVQAEFPQYAKFGDLPQEAVKMAVEKNISLYDAMLRYERTRSKSADAAAQTQASAAAASVGSQGAQPPAGSPNPTVEAMLAGLKRGLG